RRPGIQKDCGWGPAVTWHAPANHRADRTSQLGFKQTTVRSERHWGPAPFAWAWGPARRREGVGGRPGGGGAQGRVTASLTYSGRGLSPTANGRGRGAARPEGRGSPRQGTRGEEEAGSQSGSIRFSHRPRCGSQQLGRREEWQRPGSPVSRRLSARRGPQAPGTRLPRRQDAQEEGQLRRRGRQGRGEFGAFCGGWWVSREPLACLSFSLTLLFLSPSPRGDRRGCQLNLLPKWKRSRKRQQRR
uniref:High mobility group nucleosome binding domain 1 n=1 Tax=Papio anubis TaxID=9555 RepID=A0A8I5R8P5_PAPAN